MTDPYRAPDRIAALERHLDDLEERLDRLEDPDEDDPSPEVATFNATQFDPLRPFRRFVWLFVYDEGSPTVINFPFGVFLPLAGLLVQMVRAPNGAGDAYPTVANYGVAAIVFGVLFWALRGFLGAAMHLDNPASVEAWKKRLE